MAIKDIDSFLGIGVSIPFRRDASDFARNKGIEHIMDKVRTVLGTQAGSENSNGELPWRGDFGSRLHLLRHVPNTEVAGELARIYTIEALRRWVPEVRLKSTTIRRESTDSTGYPNVLVLIPYYDIVGSNGSVIAANLSQSIEL